MEKDHLGLLRKYLKFGNREIQEEWKKILVVCAHPDDETLGMGGTIALHTGKKRSVFVLIVSEGESARGRNNSKNYYKEKKQARKKLSKLLGVKRN